MNFSNNFGILIILILSCKEEKQQVFQLQIRLKGGKSLEEHSFYCYDIFHILLPVLMKNIHVWHCTYITRDHQTPSEFDQTFWIQLSIKRTSMYRKFHESRKRFHSLKDNLNLTLQDQLLESASVDWRWVLKIQQVWSHFHFG